MHPSVAAIWQAFSDHAAPSGDSGRPISHFYFCDNEQDADECARLAVIGRKRATASSLWSLTSAGTALPQAGDLHVVTDWAGVAQCIIRTSAVEMLALDAVTEEHARTEGEGDGSLAWWRAAHWAYYRRELAGSGQQVTPDMTIVFERFDCVFCALPGAVRGA